MLLVKNSRASWDFGKQVGQVQLDLAGAPVATLAGLDAANFAAVLAVLKSDPQIFFEPKSKLLFSPN